MWYIKEDYRGANAVADIAAVFIRPWLVMLVLGGLGHRLAIPYLFKDYWTVWLAVLVVRALESGSNPWRIEMISGDVKAPEHDPLAFVYDGTPQRSPEWLAIKRGRIGASSLWRWLSVSKAKGKAGTPLKERLDYEKELMFERQFGVSFSVYVNSAMQEGIDYEAYAAQEYANLRGVTLEEVGCWYNDFIAVSPDRKIIGQNAGIEVKIVKDNTFTEILVSGVPDKHYKQIQGQLWATGWDYIDYVALNFNTKKFVVIRVVPNQEDIDYMKLSVQEQLVVDKFELADRVFDITQALPEDVELGAPIDRSDSNTNAGGWN